MFALWETIKVYVLGSILIAAIAGTWTVQNWRYAGREMAYIKLEEKLVQQEAKKQAKAATNFESKQGKSNEVYDAIHRALQALGNTGSLCLDAERLRIVNAALARQAPNPR